MFPLATALLALVLAVGWQRTVRVAGRLAATNAELEDLQDHQQEFAAVTAHELRTPVTVVGGFAQTLHGRWDEIDEPTRRMMVDRLAASTRRLTGLVEDLMTATLSRRGDLQLVPGAMSLSAFVDAAVSGSRLATRPPVLDLDASAVLRVDPTYGPRMLANLLDNAAKYGRPPVEVQGRRVDGHVDIVVRDHGDGVPPEFEAWMFQPYRQAERHERRRRGGVGLGLHTVARLAELSGGSIHHRRPVDGGAEFTLRLPAAHPDAEVVE